MRLLLATVSSASGTPHFLDALGSFSFPYPSEFTLAEIEHFVDPRDKRHPKFESVRHFVLPLYPRENQVGDKVIQKMTIGDAVARGVVNNETLGYFLVRDYMFLTRCGIKPDAIRFRQHLENEMAHYASDCWDAEIKNSYVWSSPLSCLCPVDDFA